ncbi:hypothetical protein V2O64_14605 [Verrucomicrobiaceae bacterium 227]
MRSLLLVFAGLLFFAMKLSAIGLPTSEVAIVGTFHQGPIDLALEVDANDFNRLFRSNTPENYPAEVQALQFFRNGGTTLSVVRIDPRQTLATALRGSLSPPRLRGLGALLPLSNLGLLVCPELTSLSAPEMAECLNQIEILGEDRPLFTLLDPPPSVTTASDMITWQGTHLPASRPHAAVYFPKLQIDPATWSGGTSMELLTTGASGTVAAVIQKNDTTRGIWKAPAGPTATILTEGLTVNLNTTELDELNQSGINSIRDLTAYGQVLWGSRTLDTGTENRYLSVARTRRWIIRSLQRDLSDAALQPNNTILWSDLKQRTDDFLQSLFLEGALAGETSSKAYFAKCNQETTTPGDVAAHRVNLLIGVAFLRSAEFSVDEITLKTLDESQPSPALPFLMSPPVEGVLYLRFPTVPGYNHRFQSSGNLRSGSWFSGSQIAGDGSWVTLEHPLSFSQSFFRVGTNPGW